MRKNITTSADLVEILSAYGGVVHLPISGTPKYVWVETGYGVREMPLPYSVAYGAIGKFANDGVVDTMDALFGEKNRKYHIMKWFDSGTQEYEQRYSMQADKKTVKAR